MPRLARPLSLFLSSVLLVFARDASAELTKEQCIDANRQVQSLRRAEKLREARDFLELCLDPQCPALVRSDCFERLDEIERVQPTIVFDVKDASGRDLSDVQVTIDGRPFTDNLNGAALAADPGLHEFAFQAAGEEPVKQSFVLKESEKERRERIVLSPIAKSSSSNPAARSATAAARQEGRDVHAAGAGAPWKTLGLVTGGAGVASVAVAAVFGLMARSASNAQKAACPSSPCDDPAWTRANSHHSTATRDAAVSDVAFPVGGLLVVGGALLFFATPSAASAPVRRGLQITPTVGTAGGTLMLSGTFD